MNTMNTKDILKKLSEAIGVAGAENSAGAVAAGLLKPYCEVVRTDVLGNVLGIIGDDSAKPTVMLDAHIDEIGLSVTYIDDDGFVKLGARGGCDPRVLPAAQLTIHGRRDIKGVVCVLPPHVADSKKDGAAKLEELVVDTGYSKEALENLISLGDAVTVDVTFAELQNGRVTGKAFDDRGGVTAVLYALDCLKDKETRYNIRVSFSVQEEVGGRGAVVSAYKLDCDYAIAVDASFALQPETKPEKCGKMSKGVMIGTAPGLDGGMFTELKNLAKERDIPFQIEVMSESTGTDADDIAAAKGGVRTALLSFPERNMHTPVEVVDTKDIESAGELIAAFIEKNK